MSRTPWTFHDPVTLETWTLPINPNAMTSPHRPKSFVHARGSRVNQNEARSWLLPPEAWEWQFEGVFRTEEQHDAFLDWAQRPYPIEITDHLGHGRLVVFSRFAPEERQPTAATPWRFRYRTTVLILQELT